MTSEERKENRYRRRVKARQQKKRERCSENTDFETVFSFRNLYKSYQRCCVGVAWKASVQRYMIQAPINVRNTHRELLAGKYRSPGFFEFDIFERGKKRHIRSTIINERVVQKTLCDYALIPVLCRSLIYDNGASTKNKGYDFAIDRLTAHLQKHYRKYGNDGYILLFDFSKFFDNISHAVIKGIVDKGFDDERIKALTYHFIDAFGDVGLGLGSQISQVFALLSANRLDHFIKEVLRIKGYARYMDDGYLIHPSKEYLQQCMEAIKLVCDELGIVLNQKKTQIVKISHGFTFLKARFFLTESGKVVKKIYKRSVTKMRRKLKKLRKKLLAGDIEFSYVFAAMKSWSAYADRFDAFNTKRSMEMLFNRLFVWEWNYDIL